MIPSPHAQRQAIQRLIRPWEVAHLVRTVPLGYLPVNHSFTENVAGWFQEGELQYIADPSGPFDYWCSPAVTLDRKGGDCDDLAIFGASFLRRGGVKASVVVGSLWSNGTWGGHAWVEGSDRFGWFLLEGTSGGLYRGQRPAWYVASHVLSPAVSPLEA
ncbi:hypothetical protein Q664_25765 [Archangium violaceum Cb vi76]|uniref:Transglutaminase-like domain-containing protein n=2 Tax=Archangium violaceum TaxID=83451 RepID=A0A084SQZ3_9BACT|nr:hypothetical protein Q664_25765 [Archangium violaceum Cb vi76]